MSDRGVVHGLIQRACAHRDVVIHHRLSARRRGSDAASRHLPTREQTYHHHPDNNDVVQDNFEKKDKCHSVSIDSRIEDGECAKHNIHWTSAKAAEL